MRYRLLALDVDGTLLDPDGNLRPTVRQAITAAQERGVEVVLCTGRRFRTALPLAEALQLHAPLVVHNGGLVKDPRTSETLHQTYIKTAVYRRVFDVFSQFSVPMVYVDAFHDNVDILTEDVTRAHPYQQEYLEDNTSHHRVLASMATPPDYGVIMMGIMADEATLLPLRQQLTETLGHHVRINMLINKNYQGHILEALPPRVTKWAALRRLAALLDIPERAIMAVGDDENDREMIQHAGLGVAMGNARQSVKAIADHVTASNAEDGLVQAIERFLL